MKTIKIAMIGSGYINDYHARGLMAQNGVEIVAVCSSHLEKATAFADRHGITRATTDMSELTGGEDIDAVVMGIPNKFHAPYTIEFLKNGKDVFQEKPLAVNSAEGEEIIRVSRQTEKLVMVGHMWRFDTEATYIRDLVQSGAIGEVVKTKGYGIHVNWGPSGWFVQKELAGGGALADMGVHAIDTIRFILGDPLPKKVYARIGTFYGDYDVDDTSEVFISWDNGSTSIVESGWWHPHMDGPEAAVRVYGTKGYASLFPTQVKMKMGGVPGKFKPEFPERKEHCDQSMYTRQMAYFVDCVRKRQTPIPGLEEGQWILRMVDAAYRSSEMGQAIDL